MIIIFLEKYQQNIRKYERIKIYVNIIENNYISLIIILYKN